jgi:hypothetical protein
MKTRPIHYKKYGSANNIEWTACGHWNYIESWVRDPELIMTRQRGRVTCKNCLRTKIFR